MNSHSRIEILESLTLRQSLTSQFPPFFFALYNEKKGDFLLNFVKANMISTALETIICSTTRFNNIKAQGATIKNILPGIIAPQYTEVFS